ncbi:MAG: YHS domain-containing (seleno)protein [Pseudomonadota bacterium]
MRKFIAFFAALMAVFAMTAPAQAQFGFGKKDFIYEKGGYAIDGYDTVAYFDLDATALDDDGLPTIAAVKGDPQYSAEYNGATWIFSTADNLAKFEADPAKYAPEFNGYCAYAAAQGNLARTNPNAWRVVDGKLYLNFNSKIQRRWVKDIPGHIDQAHENWADLADNLKEPGA